jgi:hypothetical protein
MKKPEGKSTITITFGDSGENHVGMQKLSEKAQKGFTTDDLLRIFLFFKDDYDVEHVYLESYLPKELRSEKTRNSSILIIRDAIQAFELDHDETFRTLKGLEWDSKFWSQKHGRVVNKKARWNLCFADFQQDPDYEAKKGRVYDFKDVSTLEKIRSDMASLLGEHVSKFIAEGNYYHDSSSCGIGYHSDNERKMVIAIRFGEPMPLVFQWYHLGAAIGPKMKFTIGGGDMYIMSEKAVGTDWMTKKIPTLRHAAGSQKYTGLL